jgi:cell division protein FtsL
MWFLVSSVVVTALFVVNVRHQHRIAYLAYQTEEARRDALNDEWGQLLVEENLWAFPHRIERDANKFLAMRPPRKEDVKYIDMAMVEVADGAR